MSLSTQQIREILAVIDESGWDEAEITIGDTSIHVSKGAIASTSMEPAKAPAAVVETPAPIAALQPVTEPVAVGTGAAATTVPSGTLVGSPVLGMFWRAPEPGAPPFVDVGTTVAVGDTLCIVEVMKLMNHIPAETAGTVVAVHAVNGDMVEAGAPLFTIEAA
jgi:acetyl-CoA carboxylase biotin carboxyl carrier protein